MRERKQEDYKALRKAGVCVNCRKEQSQAGAMCHGCRTSFNNRLAAKREDARRRKICVNCLKSRVTPGKPTCRACRKKKKLAARALRKTRRLEAVCTKCGGEIPFAREGYKTCGSC